MDVKCLEVNSVDEFKDRRSIAVVYFSQPTELAQVH